MTNFFQRNRIFLLHLSFWCFYLSFYIYVFSSRPGRDRDINIQRLLTFSTLQFSFAMLVAYINYFLFNTLNNLYYLAYSHSPNTTEVIEKLSQMMRYMIYDSNYPKVPLSKEIEYMQNYISLERLRLNNEVPIEFVVEGSADDILVAQLIFITFLENAFKHGVTANTADSWVKIHFHVKGNEIIYTVENSKLSGAVSE